MCISQAYKNADVEKENSTEESDHCAIFNGDEKEKVRQRIVFLVMFAAFSLMLR